MNSPEEYLIELRRRLKNFRDRCAEEYRLHPQKPDVWRVDSARNLVDECLHALQQAPLDVAKIADIARLYAAAWSYGFADAPESFRVESETGAAKRAVSTWIDSGRDRQGQISDQVRDEPT